VAEPLAIVHVYPELLGTYGDRGNVLALVHRARGRGLRTRVLEIGLDDAIPSSADLYMLGGGEDAAQLVAARALLADERAAVRALEGRPCFAVCAGLQLLAQSFEDGEGRVHLGLGLLDATCGLLPERAVGEVVTDPELEDLPTLTGYENHRGTADLGADARPLGRVVAGVGNGDHRSEGVVQGSVIATYLHGPALVRNPALADLLLTRVAGPLPPYDDPDVEQLRRERLDAADPRRHGARKAFLGRLAG
jgi:lipid II isoglutaminyl synthase (glutamine-hydrolysing)